MINEFWLTAVIAVSGAAIYLAYEKVTDLADKSEPIIAAPGMVLTVAAVALIIRELIFMKNK